MPGTTIRETTDPNRIIQFTEDDHKYILRSKLTGEEKELISVTTLIGRYFPEFDADAVAPRVAAKRGITAAQVKAEWDAIRDEASRYGTRVHEFMEDILTGNKVRNKPENEKEQRAFAYGLTLAKRLREKIDNIECEKVVVDPSIFVAGTIDLLCRDPKTGMHMIFDWKTNKRIDMKNDWGKTGYPPISHLDDCEFAHYSLQLNLYEFILKHAGYIDKNEKVEKYLVHIHHEQGTNLLRVPPMMNDIKNIILDYLKGLQIV